MVVYDAKGRMLYHPDFHFNHRKPMSIEEVEYLCYFFDTDDIRSLSFALGRTEVSLSLKYHQLLKEGKVEHYKARYRARLIGD